MKGSDTMIDHKELAKEYFNKTWEYIDNKSRSENETIDMIHCAHASIFHWKFVGNHINFSRGEWLVSRVYAILGLGESAVFHGKECLRICIENNIGDFDLAFAYESMARGYDILGDEGKYEEFYKLCIKQMDEIKDDNNREYLKSELESIR